MDETGPQPEELALEESCFFCKGTGKIDVALNKIRSRGLPCQQCGGSGLMPTVMGKHLLEFVIRHIHVCGKGGGK